MIVSVHPITKKPICVEPPEWLFRIFEGSNQNVAEVSEEWVSAEKKRLVDIFRDRISQELSVRL